MAHHLHCIDNVMDAKLYLTNVRSNKGHNKGHNHSKILDRNESCRNNPARSQAGRGLGSSFLYFVSSLFASMYTRAIPPSCPLPPSVHHFPQLLHLLPLLLEVHAFLLLLRVEVEDHQVPTADIEAIQVLKCVLGIVDIFVNDESLPSIFVGGSNADLSVGREEHESGLTMAVFPFL